MNQNYAFFGQISKIYIFCCNRILVIYVYQEIKGLKVTVLIHRYAAKRKGKFEKGKCFARLQQGKACVNGHASMQQQQPRELFQGQIKIQIGTETKTFYLFIFVNIKLNCYKVIKMFNRLYIIKSSVYKPNTILNQSLF